MAADRVRVRGCVLAALVGAGLLAGPAGAQRVGELWRNNCARCHGEDGSGANATSLLNEEWVVGPTPREMFEATASGVEEYGMPAYAGALSDEEIWALVVHMQELRARAAEERGERPEAGEDGVWRTRHHDFRVEDVIAEQAGLETPWSVASLHDGSMLVTERPGRLRVFRDGELGEAIEGTPDVRARGQGGMLDVAPHPEHAENAWIYLAFSDEAQRGGRSVGMTKVVRGRIEGGRWVDEETIYEADESTYLPTNLHFGCRIVFTPDGDGGWYVYFGIGERGMDEHAQDLGRPNGKIHRLHEDGRVPDDNPFVDREGALPSIYCLGTRNPQGMAVDGAGRVWINEHGPRGGDELNLVEAGRNFGWPVVSYGIQYNGLPLETPWPEEEGQYTEPVVVWTPSIAACGLDFGSGGAFPRWEGDSFSGGLVDETVRRVRLEARAGDGGPAFEVVEREEVLHGLGRVRDVVVGPEGAIYVVLNRPDKVVRLAPVEE